MTRLSAPRLIVCALFSVLALPAMAGVSVSEFGVLKDGRPSHLYRLTNASGSSAELTELGALLVSLKVPNNKGKYDDVVLGFDDLEQYLSDSPFFGATVGRYANRIARGRFNIRGNSYQLANNNPPNHLHGRSEERRVGKECRAGGEPTA